jgi:hypothetical protein
MIPASNARQSQLFTLRLWQEQIDDRRSEWRGQVQEVTTGEARYFRDWQTLIEHLRGMIGQSGPDWQLDQKEKPGGATTTANA